MSAVTLHETASPSDEDSAGALAILRTFTRASVPRLQGGLLAQSRWGSFHVDILALGDTLRGQGWGTRLMQKAEAEARSRHCHHMRLDTYAFQAKAFYERHGFEVYGQIEGPEPYYPHYFMMKRI